MTISPRRRIIGIAVASIALAGSIAPAHATQNPSRAGAAVQGQNQRDNAERKICARFELTGSRFRERICMTAAEWEREGGLPTARK
ncbi:MAG TPA: hypothetical protein VEZ41_03195 [Allosphingosinicella sp.]|nr:hypothetical protein [Allosphingosinicella sp.]